MGHEDTWALDYEEFALRERGDKELGRGGAEARRGGGSVLVLDAENRSGLAVVRSLGRAGLNVIAASHTKNAIGLASKFVSDTGFYSNPAQNPEKFIDEVLSLVEMYKPEMLLPCSDLTLELILSRESEFRNLTCLPFNNQQIINKIINKATILEIANSCGIDTPQSTTSITDLENFPLPAVVKASKSFNKGANGFSKPSVEYAKTKQELKEIVKKFDGPILIQQKITGHGIGVFTLSKEGKVFSVFCHKRLLEKPPTGGVSVLSESIPENEAPVLLAKKLIEALKLDGAAMLEFKTGADGKFYLMEINPRFWGSLQLAISSGRDFPLLLYKTFVKQEEQQEQTPYKVGVRLRWILGSLDHLLIRLKNEGFAVLFSNSLMLFQRIRKTKFDVFDLSDIKPFFRELRNYL